ncbi:MAG TPA: aminoglycoside phosphotransferase family protein [Candidatus Cloacimonadota bacterium]|nr:aminoglycoside phosphotransferase family protein [Candidatus Cloacimonadota bacterium]HPM02870.1 aminoglycoside phosphotransferase family protein [Candidatus Cloacimonadota bacterium]
MSIERKNKVQKMDLELAKKLFLDFDESVEIESVEWMPQGKSTSNYQLKQKNSHEKYVLRILPQQDESCRKELLISQYLNEVIPIPEIYYTNETCTIIDKPYQIVEFIEGISLAQYLMEGNELSSELTESIAEKSALIHRTIYEKEGSINAQFEIGDDFPPIKTWYDFFLSHLAGERLGETLKNEVISDVKRFRDEFDEVCSYFVLSHGDFRPENMLVFNGKLQALIDWEYALSAPVYFDTGQFFRYSELFPRKTERLYVSAYNANALYPMAKDWRLKGRLMDCVNLLSLLNLPDISQIWQDELIRKIREYINLNKREGL